MYAGNYGISSGERLSSVLRRAGGFGPLAYPYAIVFTRENIRTLEEKNRSELVQRIQQEVTAGENIADSPAAHNQAVLLQHNQTITRPPSLAVPGREGLAVSGDSAE